MQVNCIFSGCSIRVPAFRKLNTALSAAGRPGVATFQSKSVAPAPPIASTAEPHSNPLQLKVSALQKSVAGINRGVIASKRTKADVEQLVEDIEGSAPPVVQLSKLDGTWELIYSSVEPFRSSPFFWAFKEGLLSGNSTLANAIFAYTDSVPGAEVGVAQQTIDLQAGTLVSEVDLEVLPLPGLPGAWGTVVTACSIEAFAPNCMYVTVNSTRVANSNVAGPVLDNVAVPVQQIFEALRGRDATRVQAEITYLDDDLRITRTLPGRELFVYRRI